MFVLIKYTSSIEVVPFAMTIDAYGHTGTIEPVETNKYLTTDTRVSEMLSPGKILAISCATCSNGNDYGRIYFYNIDNLDKIYTHEGNRNNKFVGQVIEYREETHGAEQFWFTSVKSDTIWINTITFFKGKYKE